MSGILYLCPTPIGNLSDMTPRVIETLKQVDLIAAEDTRNTLRLLNCFDIDTPVTSYHEHNKASKGGNLIEKLLSGKNIAVCSDAGMPAISDPGEDLVKLAIKNDIQVVPLTGPCALTTALIASGLPTGRFSFEGFLSVTKKSRFEHLNDVKNDTRTLIFYEAPHKLIYTLRDMLDIFGDREICLARELTKKYEEFNRTTLSEAVKYYEENSPKGEFVLIIAGKNKDELKEEQRAEKPSAEVLLKEYETEELYGKELVKKVAEELELPKREVYDLYLKLQKK